MLSWKLKLKNAILGNLTVHVSSLDGIHKCVSLCLSSFFVIFVFLLIGRGQGINQRNSHAPAQPGALCSQF